MLWCLRFCATYYLLTSVRPSDQKSGNLPLSQLPVGLSACVQIRANDSHLFTVSISRYKKEEMGFILEFPFCRTLCSITCTITFFLFSSFFIPKPFPGLFKLVLLVNRLYYTVLKLYKNTLYTVEP